MLIFTAAAENPSETDCISYCCVCSGRLNTLSSVSKNVVYIYFSDYIFFFSSSLFPEFIFEKRIHRIQRVYYCILFVASEKLCLPCTIKTEPNNQLTWTFILQALYNRKKEKNINKNFPSPYKVMYALPLLPRNNIRRRCWLYIVCALCVRVCSVGGTVTARERDRQTDRKTNRQSEEDQDRQGEERTAKSLPKKAGEVDLC